MFKKKGLMYWVNLLKEIVFVATRGLRHFKKLGTDTRNYAKSVWVTISIIRMNAAYIKSKAVKIYSGSGKDQIETTDQKIRYVLRLLKSKPILFGDRSDDQLRALINDYMQGVR